MRSPSGASEVRLGGSSRRDKGEGVSLYQSLCSTGLALGAGGMETQAGAAPDPLTEPGLAVSPSQEGVIPPLRTSQAQVSCEAAGYSQQVVDRDAGSAIHGVVMGSLRLPGLGGVGGMQRQANRPVATSAGTTVAAARAATQVRLGQV